MNTIANEEVRHERVLRPPEVQSRLGIGSTTLWRWVRDGVLIPPSRIGLRAVGWRESVLNRWIAERESAR